MLDSFWKKVSPREFFFLSKKFLIISEKSLSPQPSLQFDISLKCCGWGKPLFSPYYIGIFFLINWYSINSFWSLSFSLHHSPSVHPFLSNFQFWLVLLFFSYFLSFFLFFTSTCTIPTTSPPPFFSYSFCLTNNFHP